MILGTQWYILFNVIAGASALPQELRDVGTNLRVRGLLWWRKIGVPAILPFYVTGAITASGGSWNASIVSEVASWGDMHLTATGIGAYIAAATNAGDFHRVVLGIAVMAFLVVLTNRTFWRPLYRYAERKFRMGVGDQQCPAANSFMSTPSASPFPSRMDRSCSSSTASSSTSPRGRSWAFSADPAPASRRCCA